MDGCRNTRSNRKGHCCIQGKARNVASFAHQWLLLAFDKLYDYSMFAIDNKKIDMINLNLICKFHLLILLNQ